MEFKENFDDYKFHNFIVSLLEKAEIGKENIELITDEKSMIEFKRAFTHKSVDPIHNYEFYEILGDVTTNKIVVWYYNKRFPHLVDIKETGNMGGVAIMARLKMTGISKPILGELARDLRFQDYVRVNEEETTKLIGKVNQKINKTGMLEDVFEAFIGCLEYLVDTNITPFGGYGISYIFMSRLIDKREISLLKEDLYDEKSLLNEDINKFKGDLKIDWDTYAFDQGRDNPAFLEDKNNISKRFKVYLAILDKQKNELYKSDVPGYGSNKAKAQQDAAKYLRENNILEKVYNSSKSLPAHLTEDKGGKKWTTHVIDQAYNNPNFLKDKNNLSKRFKGYISVLDKKGDEIYKVSGYGSNEKEAQQDAYNLFSRIKNLVVK